MIKFNYDLGDILILKKGHPCGANEWEVIRLGADIKLKCLGCNRVVLVGRHDLDKKIKSKKICN